MLRLNVGCGDKKINGFVNIDVRKTSSTDIVSKAWKIKNIPENSVDLIYSRHMLEHLYLSDAKKTLKHWYKLLKKSGSLNLITPDLHFHCKQLIGKTKSKKFDSEIEHAMAGFYGWHDPNRGGNKFDSHKWGYSFSTLEQLLVESGFKFVQRNIYGKDTEQWHLNITAFKEDNHKNKITTIDKIKKKVKAFF